MPATFRAPKGVTTVELPDDFYPFLKGASELKTGTWVSKYDSCFQWDPKHCVSQADMDRLLPAGDDAADPIPLLLRSKAREEGSPSDTLERVKEMAAKGEPEAVAFWEEVTEPPPFEVDSEAMDRACTFWSKWLVEAQAGLFYFALAGGFSAPPLILTLSHPSSNYLASGNAQATYVRLLETGQWSLDCTDSASHNYPPTQQPDGSWSPGGRGWESTVRVRLLHANMRMRVNERLEDIAVAPGSKSVKAQSKDLILRYELLIGEMALVCIFVAAWVAFPLWQGLQMARPHVALALQSTLKQ